MLNYWTSLEQVEKSEHGMMLTCSRTGTSKPIFVQEQIISRAL
jgi:hypothetical protein